MTKLKISESILVAVLCLIFSHVSFSQNDTTKMLLKWKRPNYIGLYLAPEMQLGKVAGSTAMLSGGSIMAIVDKKWAIGATGMSLRNRNFQPSDVTPLYLSGGYGGLKLEYTPRPNGAIHVSFPLVIGVGFAKTDSTSTRYGRNHNHRDHNDFINNGTRNQGRIIAAPGVNFEANIFRFGKIFVGAQYLWMESGTDVITGQTANYLDGISLKVGAKVGFFDYYIGKKTEENPLMN